ncbi:MAG: hypothetical protein P0Y49_05050 [Candidatus Pedobacter colombiensis]|uniref:Crp/Fnr family transcriptional regulator n=1 Tax=Candidatus Pedobacter colombiensis TaxID=3121371 RepID=A0AAJ5WAQ2_9SPHI|nr:hypothetical protein [Pedobacter sp.]WEK20503.1 MAG: hypothetical protein P0Y49_05050 [Pedobacter sp.]
MNNHHLYVDLIRHLLSFMQMPKGFVSLLLPCLVPPKTYTEDTTVLKFGEIANMIYWPVKGYIRAYKEIMPEEDRMFTKQKTIDISSPGRMAFPINSFINQVEADYFLEITKGSTVIGFSYTSFIALSKQMPEVALLILKMVGLDQNNWLLKMEMCKVFNWDGYLLFLDHFGMEVTNFIKQQDIASYIGMSAEELYNTPQILDS